MVKDIQTMHGGQASLEKDKKEGYKLPSQKITWIPLYAYMGQVMTL